MRDAEDDLDRDRNSPEDALEDLAKKRVNAEDIVGDAKRGSADASDALASMAAGLHEDTDAENAPENSEPSDRKDAQQDILEHSPDDVPVDSESQRTAKAMRQRNAAKSHSLQLRKLMVPPMFVVGVLLLVLSGATLLVILTGQQSIGSLQTDNFAKLGPYLVLVSCPLALILVCGAWWLHIENKKHTRNS